MSAALLLLAAASLAAPERLVVVGPPLTETVIALGAGPQIVGVDASSTLPPEHARVARVGYHRTLSAEGLLALRPDRVLVTEEAGPPAVLDQLRGLGVKVERFAGEPTVESTRDRILAVGRVLGREAEAKTAVAALDADLARARERIAARKGEPPTVLFLFARGAGAQMVGCSETLADALIRLAGAKNAAVGCSGYKPLNPEFIASTSPDVLLLPKGTLASMGGLEGVLKLPGVALTAAGRGKRVGALEDGQFMGFGPGLGKTVLALQDLLERYADGSGP